MLNIPLQCRLCLFLLMLVTQKVRALFAANTQPLTDTFSCNRWSHRWTLLHFQMSSIKDTILYKKGLFWNVWIGTLAVPIFLFTLKPQLSGVIYYFLRAGVKLMWPRVMGERAGARRFISLENGEVFRAAPWQNCLIVWLHYLLLSAAACVFASPCSGFPPA